MRPRREAWSAAARRDAIPQALQLPLLDGVHPHGPAQGTLEVGFQVLLMSVGNRM